MLNLFKSWGFTPPSSPFFFQVQESPNFNRTVVNSYFLVNTLIPQPQNLCNIYFMLQPVKSEFKFVNIFENISNCIIHPVLPTNIDRKRKDESEIMKK